MRAFITGGAGFIGSHLADALIARGDSITILDNLSTGSKKNIAHLEGKITVHEGDIREKELVDKLVAESDVVYHMAAALGVKNIMDHTIESIDRNFNGSEVILHAATKHGKRLLIASTSEIYGKNPNQPLHEESDRVVGAPQKIRWTYSDAKALEEAVAHTLQKTQGLKVTTFRFFNNVGPRQTGQDRKRVG
jgi:UDP-glucose 4-epimerase